MRRQANHPCGADPLVRAGPPGPAFALRANIRPWSKEAYEGVGRGPGGPPHKHQDKRYQGFA